MARAYSDEQAIISLSNDYAKFMPIQLNVDLIHHNVAFVTQRLNTKEKV